MRTPVFFIQLDYVRAGHLETITERIVDIKNYKSYFDSYEKAEQYLLSLKDTIKNSEQVCTFYEFSIKKVWIDEEMEARKMTIQNN